MQACLSGRDKVWSLVAQKMQELLRSFALVVHCFAITPKKPWRDPKKLTHIYIYIYIYVE